MRRTTATYAGFFLPYASIAVTLAAVRGATIRLPTVKVFDKVRVAPLRLNDASESQCSGMSVVSSAGCQTLCRTSTSEKTSYVVTFVVAALAITIKLVLEEDKSDAVIKTNATET
jgi:hypothetical protein